jgi:hypothetical protein
MKEIFDLDKRGSHNDRVTKIVVIASKPVDLKVKVEIHLIIVNRLANLNQSITS